MTPEEWRAQNRKLSHVYNIYYSGLDLFVTLGYNKDGGIDQIWVDGHREGSEFRAILTAIGMLMSVAMNRGFPAEEIASRLSQYEYSKYLKVIMWVLKHPHYEIPKDDGKQIVLTDEDMV